MKRVERLCLLFFVASWFESILCTDPVGIVGGSKRVFSDNEIPSSLPRYSGRETQNYLKGKDIENLGWIMASFTHDNVDASTLPKRVFKNYIAAKDRLFVDYLDIFLGNTMSRTGKLSPESYRMMSTTLRRRRFRHKDASLDKSGSVTSTYLLRGNPATATKDFSAILDVIGSHKGALQTNIGPFSVSSSTGSGPQQSVITFRLDGMDQAKPGCITRRFIYQPRVIRVQFRKTSMLRNLKLKGQKGRATARMIQMQRRKQEQAKRKQQRQKQMRINIQRRRQRQRERQQRLKAKAKARLQKRLENAKRRKLMAQEKRKAKEELRKRKQEDRKAQKLMRQKQKQLKKQERELALQGNSKEKS